MSKVLYEVDGAVALVTINRPEVLNAIDQEVFFGVRDAAERAGADPAIRAVVLTGEGKAFSSGLDTSLFASGMGGGSPLTLDISALQRCFTVYETIPKPTIAAVGGLALGGGIQLAAACDLRVAAEDAELAVYEIRWGIIPDLGGTQRLPRLIGLGRAKELVMTGRRVKAEEALAWGLVNRVVPRDSLLEEAIGWARELAAGPPLAVAAAKRLATGAFETPLSAGLEREAMVNRRLLATEDFREAVMSRFEKREPTFRAR
ncbi:MAG: enoyl-CoA hydratase/isomerase family protein [Actinomycetota bacterium]